ncbi:MAG: hypothetical protein J4G15_17020 [Alphaproteobacteria bacterium]|nr:hypothetical protein [Alphaproteobacteria bacterium]
MFRVRPSGVFWDGEGRLRYPGVNFNHLEGEPGLEVVCLPYCDGTNAAEIVDLDAFIPFWSPVMAEAPGPEPRLAVDR